MPRGLGLYIFILGGESIILSVKLRESKRDNECLYFVGISNNSEQRESPGDVGNLVEPCTSVSHGLIV